MNRSSRPRGLLARSLSVLLRILFATGALYGLAFLAAYATSIHPGAVVEEAVTCDGMLPAIPAGEPLRLLSWNVQYMAGKDSVFFYDLPDGSGPDSLVDRATVARTLDAVARVIRDHDVDLVLLQEIDEDSRRTAHVDQLAELLARLPDERYCRSQTFYWRARFVPHPRILGSVGMKLVTLSRYRIDRAIRHALPRRAGDPLYRQLYFHRALLETRLPVSDGRTLVAVNTHFDAFSQGSDLMARQVFRTTEVLRAIGRLHPTWIFAGDLNLLPPGIDPSSLHPDDATSYRSSSELTPFFEEFASAPKLAALTGPSREQYFTSFPNHPEIPRPNKTIDYVFHGAGITVEQIEVLRGETLEISDHLPWLATLRLSSARSENERGPR